MNYTFEDAFQASIGIFSSLLLFLALRQDPIVINPLMGFGITIIWVSLFYNGGKSGLPRQNFFINLIITFVLSGVFTQMFGLTTFEQLLSFDYFGSASVVCVWLSFPISLLYDRFQITNMLRRHYVRGR